MSVAIKDAGLVFSSLLTGRAKTTHLIIHHAAGENMSVEDIHRIHKNNGWLGIGYNFYIRKDGTICKGRGWEYVGAHATNYNSFSIGVCFEGNYDSSSTAMPEAQYNAGVALIGEALTRYPAITTVCGHRDVMATACPGRYFPLSEMIADGKAGGRVVVPTDTITPIKANAPVPVAFDGGNAIKSLQTRLNNIYGAGLAVDGLYGSNTKKGLVKALQTELNKSGAKLVADGIFGQKTKGACVNLKQGATGNLVYILQGLLYCRGYIYSGFDGVFGANTTAEVKSFQGANGLVVDGIVGKNTWEKLLG